MPNDRRDWGGKKLAECNYCCGNFTPKDSPSNSLKVLRGFRLHSLSKNYMIT